MRFRRILPRHGASSILVSLAICVVMTTFAWGAGQAQGGGTAAAGVAGTNGLIQPTHQGAERLAAPGPSLSDAAKARQLASYSKLPLSFVPNQGQTDPQVKFTSQGRGYTLYLTPSEAVLSLSRPLRPAKSLLPGERASESSGVLRMKLAGAHASVQPTGAGLLPGRNNYYIGNDSRKWLTNVPNYGRVNYSDVYPGVDLVYYGSNQQQLEYDFVVKAGADPRAIRLAFDLAGMSAEGKKASLSIDGNGDLLIHGASGDLRFHKPQVYQPAYTGGQTRHNLDGKYVLAQNNEVRFAVAGYDKRFPLVIDPTLSFSSFLGGSGSDAGNGIAIDSNGNIDVTGATQSLDFPAPVIAASQGTHQLQQRQPVEVGNAHAFVSQISPSGSLVFSTIIGGTSVDVAQAIALDAANNIFITGTTHSTDFPASGSALQSHLKGTSDAFVASLSSAGVVTYATYGGGSGDEDGLAIYVDGSENIYVAGDTTTTDGNLVGNSGPLGYQTTYGGGASDGFLAKLGVSEGVFLSYLTYFGGSGADVITGVTADANGNAYVTGRTSSTNFPTANTTGLFDTYGGGANDAFVSGFSSTGTTLNFSTYLGGAGDDQATGIALDPLYIAYYTGGTPLVDSGAQRSARPAHQKVVPEFTPGVGNETVYDVLYSPFHIYVTGLTDNAANFLQTQSLTTTNQGGNDVFVVKLAPGLSSPIRYANFFGGAEGEYPFGIMVDISGNAYVVGSTSSANFPMVLPVQGTCGGGCAGDVPDAFLTRINPEGTALVFSTYLGGSAFDEAGGVAQDLNSGTWVVGSTNSTDFPVQSAFQATHGSGVASDVFVANIAGVSPIRNLPGFTTTVFPENDDSSVGPVSLGGSFNHGDGVNFFGSNYSQLFVNNNGDVTFGEALGEYTPTGLTTSGVPPIIAPFWADVETYGNGSGLVTYGNDTVNGHNAFGVNWINVGYYPSGVDRLNTFQLVLIDRQDVELGDFDIEFNYSKMQWETGSASGGSDGLGGSSAHIGYSNGTGIAGSFFELPGSGVNGAFLDTNTATGLIYGGNGPVIGRYAYQVRGGQVINPGNQSTVSVSPANLSFQHNLNLQCPFKPLIISNTGGQPLSIGSIVASGSFAISGNTCGATLAASTSCEVDVNFTVEAPVGVYPGALTITDNATDSPQVVPLSGEVFPPCLLQSDTTTQQILRSTPSATFNLSDSHPSCHVKTTTMACTNNQQASCVFTPATIAPGGSTVLTVQNLNALTTDSFSFTAQGTDTNNTTSVNLSVLFSDFNYTPAATSATVTAGQTANYVLTLTPVNGLTGTVNLACQGAPTGSTCSVSPSPVTLAQNAPVQVNVSVSTGSRSVAAPRGGAPLQGPGASLRLWLELASLLALLGLASWGALGTRRARAQQPNLARLRLSGLVLAALALMLMAWAACGSGGGGGPVMGNNVVGTPAGTYALTVTGTFTNSSGQTTALSRTQSLSLQVQ